MNRRRMLATAALATVGSLGGCLERAGVPSETPTPSWENGVDFGEYVDETVFVEARPYEFTPSTDEPIAVSHECTLTGGAPA